MDHFLVYMDEIYKGKIININSLYPDWIVGNDFFIYDKITPIANGIDFSSEFLLKKNRKRTSVLLEREFDRKKVRYYFNEYNIIFTYIYIYDTFEEEGNHICSEMNKLMNDNGEDVEFRLEDKVFNFKGIKYIQEDKKFGILNDYEISINDFIGLLNLVVEKDRYSSSGENGKGTILKYLFFLIFFSKRTPQKFKSEIVHIFKDKKIYSGEKLLDYQNIINKFGKEKLLFDSGLFEHISCYNNSEES